LPNADQRELPVFPESGSPHPGDNRAGQLLRRVEGVAYWLAVAPALARLPSALGYRIACWRGDFYFWCRARKRTEMTHNLRLVLGSELSPAAAHRVARDWFRFASCRMVDVMRLRRGARPLRQLVEIRGREHLEAALAAGRGAILCSGHFGSYDSGFAVLQASGFPITIIGRRSRPNAGDRSSAERWFWKRISRPALRHKQRPNIEPMPGKFQVAARAAAVLRANEVVTISIDAAPPDGDPRAIEVPFLGRQARLMPGVVTLAQLTGAPVLMAFLYRAADYRHQVWEISAPVPMEEDPAAALRRCAAEVSAAIRRSPAHWNRWRSTDALASLGLIRPQPDGSPAAGPARPPDESFRHDGPTDGVPAQDRPALLPGPGVYSFSDPAHSARPSEP
jgi:KDO2-lipid IV(A) lauroyltransferase